jgi:phage terminase small subunit
MSLPKWISEPDALTGRALSVWNSYAPSAFKAGYLKAGNVENFRMLVRLLACADAAAAEIETLGVSIEAKTGARRVNPAVSVLFSAQERAAKLLDEFGMAEDGSRFGL